MHERTALITLLWASIAGCEGARATPDAGVTLRRDAAFQAHIHRPPSLESIEVEAPDGGRVSVRCATCHELFRDDPPTLPPAPQDLHGPHADMRFAHGALPCASCHERARYDGLHLASGEVVPMTDAIRLCRQCHGPQARDYDHGSHGGMRGHWDLSRGPRERNHCVDCHDPHSPAWGQYLPAPPPRDTSQPSGGRHE